MTGNQHFFRTAEIAVSDRYRRFDLPPGMETLQIP